MSILKVRKTYKGLKRYGRIASVFVRYGFGDIVDRLKVRYYLPWQKKVFKGGVEGVEYLSTAERLRMAFEELGHTFIKLGQLLSCRPDLLPADFIKEFNKLQDRVQPFSFDDVKTIIEIQLGRSFPELFKHIDEKPVASAPLFRFTWQRQWPETCN